MPIPSQRAYIPFTEASGQSEVSNPLVDPGPVMGLINGEYGHADSIIKRRGFQSLGSVPGGMLAHQLLSAGDYGGLVAHNALLNITAAGLDAPTRSRLEHGMQAHASSAYVHTNATSATYGSVALGGAWMAVATGFAGGSEVVVLELATGAVLKRVALAFADFAQVVYLSSKFYVYYRNAFSAHVDVTVIDPTADTAITTSNLFTPNATNQQFCAVPDSIGGMLFAYQSNGGGNLLTVARSTTGTTIATSFADAGITDCESFAVVRNSINSTVHVAYSLTHAAGGDGYLATYVAALTSRTLGPTKVLDVTATDRVQVGLAQPANGHRLYVTGNGMNTTGADAWYNTCLDDHTAVGTATRLRGFYWLSAPVGLLASVNAAFNVATAPERCYALLGQNNDVEDAGVSHLVTTPTVWLAMLGPNVADSALDFADAACPVFGDGQVGGVVPVVMVVTDGGSTDPRHEGWTGMVLGATPLRGPLVPPAKVGAALYYPTAMLLAVDEANKLANRVVKVVPTFADTLPSPRVRVNGTAYLGGGLLRHYDGSGFVEQTPLHPPVANVAATIGGGGVPAAGTYGYCGVLVWEDADGDVHRSAPSAVFSVVSAGGSISIDWPGILASLSIPAQRYLSPLSLEVYRTKAGAATFYLQSTSKFAPGTTVTVVDTTSDAVLGTRRLLYTEGGVLASEPAPACTALALHQDRMWLINATVPALLHYSKAKQEGVDYEFNAASTVRLESLRDPVALTSMDDKLLVFTDRDTYAVTGAGPDATGSNGAFGPPELVARGVGATGRHSALSTPIGTIVHTPGGFRLLGRDLSVSDIGKLLTDSAPGTVSVRASVYFPDRQQAWFLLSNQYVAVFDHRRDGLRCVLHALATGLNSAALDLADIGGVPHLLSYNSGDGKHYVYRQSTTAWDDAGQFVPLVVQTGWFRPGGDTGLQDGRFRVLHVYGSAPTGADSSGLKVDIEVQGEQHSAGTKESSTFLAANVALTNPAHVRTRLKRQRGYAARVTLTQVASPAPAGVNSQGFSPFGLEWEFGVHPGTTKVGAKGNAGA